MFVKALYYYYSVSRMRQEYFLHAKWCRYTAMTRSPEPRSIKCGETCEKKASIQVHGFKARMLLFKVLYNEVSKFIMISTDFIYRIHVREATQ